MLVVVLRKEISEYISGYNLAILWGRDRFFIFDSHCRGSLGRKIVNETVVVLKFPSLNHMDDYIKRTYFRRNSTYFYFQVKFVQIKRSQSNQAIETSRGTT